MPNIFVNSSFTNMVWAVVHFLKENSVEAVPLEWYIKTSKECFWPHGYKREEIAKFIQEKASPLCDWKVYPAVLLGSYGTNI